MTNGPPEHLTPFAQAFLEPKNTTHRQYEALRAYFVDGLASAEAARRFGYTAGSFRVLCHRFRQDPRREFFLLPQKGPRPSIQTESNPERERIIVLRKQNLSVYDISEALGAEGWRRSPASVASIRRRASPGCPDAGTMSAQPRSVWKWHRSPTCAVST
jgi:hypothetical protein